MKHPDFIRGNDPASFAHYTIKKRFPKILKDIIDNNEFAVEVRSELENFLNLLFSINVEKIDKGEELELFNESVLAYCGESIFDAPFFVSEIFFYQKIASITEFHKNKQDYFSGLKQQSLTEAVKHLLQQPKNFFGVPNDSARESQVKNALNFSLWGNLADLSLFSLTKANTQAAFSDDNILINDTAKLLEFSSVYKGTIHFFLDNAGLELISDLYFIYILLRYTECNIQIHLKPIPMFVSDVTLQDWNETLNTLETLPDVSSWTSTFNCALKGKRLNVSTSSFWASCYHFSDKWFNELGISAGELVISKGDLNYRRFFEDRAWSPTVLSNEVVAKTNSTVLHIRTLKSEIITGLTNEKADWLNKQDKDWMINGKYGLIQLLTT